MAPCASGCSKASPGFRPDPDAAGLQAHHLRADDHSRALAGHRRTTTRAPAASRPAGRSRATRSTYDIAVPEGASGTLVLSPDYKDIVVDGMQLAWAGGEQSAQPARARTSQRDVPDQQDRQLGRVPSPD